MHTYGACYLGIGLSYQSQQPIDECHEDATTLYSSHAHVPAESSSAACISRQKAIQLASSPRAPTSTLTDYLGNVGTRRRLCKCRTTRQKKSHYLAMVESSPRQVDVVAALGSEKI
ncbi:hypothetical protein HYQ44_005268 [Verticillium longisporum]|nr:hypothetical protein HYQ44_005268 [Verticillium longisporum]